MADPLEIELKLELDPGDRSRLRSTSLFKSTHGETHRLVSTYFDTLANDVAQAGFSLRVRRTGRKRIQTVKASSQPATGLFARREWEHPLKKNEPLLESGSGPLVRAVGPHALRKIEEIFVTDVKRTTIRIDRDDATIELALDNGEVRADGRAERILEIEFELRHGSPRALFDLARQLDEELPVRLGVRSKGERGYALAAGEPAEAFKAEPIHLDREGDGSGAFCVIARACMRHFRLNEAPLLQSGEAEFLHQARVGLRRLRSALSLYKRWLADDPVTEMLLAELRWLAAELGEVRNIDVLIERFEGDARDRLAAARQGQFNQVRAELASSRARLLMIDLTEWLETGAWRTEQSGEPPLSSDVLSFAGDLLEARRRRFKRRGKGLAGLGDLDRHKVRIEAKKLRYATEFFASLYSSGNAGRCHERFLKSLEALQDVLGELHDLVIAPAVLAKHGIDAELKGRKHKRHRLLKKAERKYEALIGARPFWRANG